MVVYYKILKTYYEVQLTNIKIDVNNRKMKIIHPPQE